MKCNQWQKIQRFYAVRATLPYKTNYFDKMYPAMEFHVNILYKFRDKLGGAVVYVVYQCLETIVSSKIDKRHLFSVDITA